MHSIDTMIKNLSAKLNETKEYELKEQEEREECKCLILSHHSNIIELYI